MQTQLITEKYKQLNEQLHKENPEYGSNAQRWVTIISEIIKIHKVKTILDYGCGKGGLKIAIGDMVRTYVNYDPCIAEFNVIPTGKFDLIVCVDVMEHIEEECTDNVLNDIFNYAGKLVFFNIASQPAKKKFSDGTNTHINLKSEREWLRILQKWFNFINVQQINANSYSAINYFGSSIKYNGT